MLLIIRICITAAGGADRAGGAEAGRTEQAEGRGAQHRCSRPKGGRTGPKGASKGLAQGDACTAQCTAPNCQRQRDRERGIYLLGTNISIPLDEEKDGVARPPIWFDFRSFRLRNRDSGFARGKQLCGAELLFLFPHDAGCVRAQQTSVCIILNTHLRDYAEQTLMSAC